MRIAIGWDHGGIVLKPAVVEYLREKYLTSLAHTLYN